MSLIPSAEPLPQEIIYTAEPQIHSGVPVIDNAVNPVLESSMTPAEHLPDGRFSPAADDGRRLYGPVRNDLCLCHYRQKGLFPMVFDCRSTHGTFSLFSGMFLL